MSLEGIEDLYPLAPTQAGLVYHSLVDSVAGVYVGQVCFRLEGVIDRDLMERTWDRLVQRHAALRVSILWGELSQPLQAVHREVSIPWQHHDWRDLSVSEQDAAFEGWKAADRSQGFDVEQPPLMRMALMRLDEGRYWLVWTSHHAVADGWSVSVLLREMCVIYRALATGVADQLPPPFQYARHIAWLESRDMAAAERYWQELLAGFEGPTELLTPPPPGSDTPSGHRATRHCLQTEVSQALRCLSRECEVSLFVVLEAAWGLLLHRYSNTSDVVFGVTASGRPPDLEGIHSAVGLFINTLPVRHKFPAEVSLGEWLRRLQADSLEFMKYEFSPLPRIKDWGGIRGGRALFDTIFVLMNYPQDYDEYGRSEGWRVLGVEDSINSNYGLALVATPGDEIALKLVYDTALYPRTVIEAMLADLSGILESMTRGGADVELFALGPPSSRDLATLTGEIGLGEALTGDPIDVVDLIAEWVSATPANIAVCCGGRQLTYANLDHQARRISQALHAMGCRPQGRVALIIDRNVDFVSAVLAVLRLGAAYVPVDRRAPSSRVEYILQDAQCEMVVAEGDVALSEENFGLPVLRLEALDDYCFEATAEDAAEPVACSDTAYIIYTSGSTGKPKGVAVTRANLAFSNASRKAYYGDDPESFLLLSAFWFDSSIAGIFWTLTTGGRLVIAEQRLEQDMAAMAKTLTSNVVTHTLCLPALYRLVLEYLDSEVLSSLRVVITAGEPLAASLVDAHRQVIPQARIYNEYGPTEATVWATVFDATDWVEPGTVPIGRPIPGAGVLVLDARGRPSPIGIAGELCITGPGVAVGYVGKPEETAAQFVETHVFAGESIRCYRTGDIARFSAGGDIEFLGRLDEQFKLRGHRIETAEIESALLQHPQIRDAVVLVTDVEPPLETNPRGGDNIHAITAGLLSMAPEEREALLEQVELSGTAG